MPTDEMIANRRQALEREKKGYELKLAGAESDEDKAKWKDRLNAVDQSLSNLGGSVLDGSVDDILNQVGDDRDQAAAILEAEQAQKKPRKSLIKGLEVVLTEEDADEE